MMKNRSFSLFLAGWTIFLFSSCITNKDKLYLQSNRDSTLRTVVSFSQYVLAPGDEIIYYLMTSSRETQALYNNGGLRYFGSGVDLSRHNMPFRINNNGEVDLPTVGKIQISGMTIREAEATVTQKFKQVVLDAEVKLALSNNYFYVEGDNGKGQFPVYKEDLNIFQALAMAGDISSAGDKAHIKIIRKGMDGIDRVVVVDLRQESIIGTEYYYIQPNDVIYIPASFKSFFRIESVSGFVSLVIAPLSLVLAALTYFK